MLSLMQECISCFAMYLYIPRAELLMSDAGIRRAENDSFKSAYKYQVQNLRNSYLTTAYAAQERLLSFIEANNTSFLEWKNSPERTQYNTLLIRSGAEFALYYSNMRYPQRMFRMLAPIMGSVEELHVTPVFGVTFSALKARKTDGSFTPEDKALTALLSKAIAYLTIAMAVPELQLRMDENGLSVLSNNADSSLNEDSKRSAASDFQVGLLAEQCKATGKGFIEAAKTYLDSKASNSVYPEWYSAINAGTGTSSFDKNLNLGGCFTM